MWQSWFQLNLFWWNCIHQASGFTALKSLSLTVVWFDPRKVRMPFMKSPNVRGSPSSKSSLPQIRWDARTLVHAKVYTMKIWILKRAWKQRQTSRVRFPWVSIHVTNGLNLLHPRKDVAEMVIVFFCVPHRSWGFNECYKIRQTCVSKVIVFCVTPIVPESFMIVSSINVLVYSNCSRMSEVLAGAHVCFSCCLSNLYILPTSSNSWQCMMVIDGPCWQKCSFCRIWPSEKVP